MLFAIKSAFINKGVDNKRNNCSSTYKMNSNYLYNKLIN